MTTLPVFLVQRLPDGEHAVLDGPEGRHAATVRRLRAGEELTLSDGHGGLARCAVTGVDRDTVALAVARRWTEPAPTPRVTVAQALVKGDRGELAVELATEAGVDEIVPWRAQRCVAKWEHGPRGERALARWRAAAREAAKQARRAWCPPVAEPVDTPALATRVAVADLALVLHESATARLTDVPLPDTGDVLLVVGPEGGIAPAELDALEGAGAELVRLGETVLRTSTAGPAALAVLNAALGRW